ALRSARVVDGSALRASLARLVFEIACVFAGPPLSSSDPSLGLIGVATLPFWSVAWGELMQVPSPSRLNPRLLTPLRPEHPRMSVSPGNAREMIELFNVRLRAP